ncbi:hypothetical protein [Serratia oryzae]|nr:hypothetical protein [Serratia oryzae]
MPGGEGGTAQFPPPWGERTSVPVIVGLIVVVVATELLVPVR